MKKCSNSPSCVHGDIPLPLEEFSYIKSRGRYRSKCKKCRTQYNKVKRQESNVGSSVYVEYKVCTKCGEEKHRAEFNKMTSHSTGLRPDCKECLKASKTAAYHRDLEKSREEHRRSYARRAESIKKSKKEHRRKYPEKAKDIARRAYRNYTRKHVDKLRQVQEPSSDDKWLYIMQFEELLKVGISSDPLHRVGDISKAVGGDVSLLFLCKAHYGRSVDAERIAHYDLAEYNFPLTYRDGSCSPEWFNCSVDVCVSVLREIGEVSEWQRN